MRTSSDQRSDKGTGVMFLQMQSPTEIVMESGVASGSGSVSPPDDLLVARVSGGDASAREELFRRHWLIARRVAFRLLGNEQDAEDAVQAGMIKAVRHLAEFDGRSQFRTWLLRIVTNSALDLGRQRGRRAALKLQTLEAAEQGDLEPAVQVDPGAGLVRDDLRKTLDQALDLLTPTLRSTFVLFAEAELSYREIAECQNIPIGTVMSRIHEARKKLQAALHSVWES